VAADAIGRRRSCDESSRRYEAELDTTKPQRCWALLEAHGLIGGARSVLDVGCGEGRFLDVARAAGLRTAGVEISPGAARVAAGKGHQVFRQSVTGTPFGAGEFDLAVMWDILEHLDDPRSGLRNVAGALRPGGKIVVLTPMVDSVYDLLGVTLYRATREKFNRLVRMCWNHDHLFRFSRRGLSGVLEGLGFTDVRARRIFLLSLGRGAYAGGALTPGWTSHARLNELLSTCGVALGRAFRLHNKVLVLATRGA
jgi:SAM-dependent methyltransferase